MNLWLVGGLEHFLFFRILGIMIPIDYIIFFRGVETTNQMNIHQLIGQKWFAARFAGMVRPNVERFFCLRPLLLEFWAPLGCWNWVHQHLQREESNKFMEFRNQNWSSQLHSLCALAPFHVSNRHGMDAGVPMPTSFYHEITWQRTMALPGNQTWQAGTSYIYIYTHTIWIGFSMGKKKN